MTDQQIREMDDDWDCPEDHVHMEDCTCEHDPEEHGWGKCLVPDCPCEGGWSE